MKRIWLYLAVLAGGALAQGPESLPGARGESSGCPEGIYAQDSSAQMLSADEAGELWSLAQQDPEFQLAVKRFQEAGFVVGSEAGQIAAGMSKNGARGLMVSPFWQEWVAAGAAPKGILPPVIYVDFLPEGKVCEVSIAYEEKLPDGSNKITFSRLKDGNVAILVTGKAAAEPQPGHFGPRAGDSTLKELLTVKGEDQ